jgi:acid phosphatase type 7
MSRDDGRETDESPTRTGYTRRRVLQAASLGAVGVAGCTQFVPNRTETPTVETPLSTLIASWRGHDPTTATTLQWIGSDETGSVDVELSPENDDTEVTDRTDVSPFGDSDLYRHRAVLTGLDPDTRYEIAVDGSGTRLVVGTAPDGLAEPVTFAAGGDIGTSSAVPPLHEQAASWDPLFGLVGGDLAYADGEDVGEWITFLEHWHEYMRTGDRLVPLVAAIGDHELRDREFYGTPDDAPFFYSLFDNVQQDRAYWTLDIGTELSILILDSNHTAEAAGAQTEWLEDALAERANRDHLLATYHVPAYPSSKPIEDEERGSIRRHWVPLFEAYGVDVAFEHDDHAYKRTHPLEDGEPEPDDGVLYLGDGAWGQEPREVKSPDERPYLAASERRRHVIRATLSPDGSREFRAIEGDGDVLDRIDETDRRSLPAR